MREDRILFGRLETIADGVVKGWGCYENDLSQILTVDIFIDGDQVARVQADLFRADLKEAGLGDGHKMFEFPLPDIFHDGEAHLFEARVEGYPLDGSPVEVVLPLKTDAVEVKPDLSASLVFDADYYLRENPDVAAVGCDPEWHYQAFGEKEGRCPNALFDVDYHKRISPDVVAAGMGLLDHFRMAGFREGRLPRAPEKPYRFAKSKKRILFIGHDAIAAGAQRVLLDIVKWFALHSDFQVTVLLCDLGVMVPEYSAYADVYALHQSRLDMNGPVAELLDVDWSLVYCNTVRSGNVAGELLDALTTRPPVVTHLHELHAVLAQFPDEFEALRRISDRFIVVNDSIAEHLVEDFGVPVEAVTVAHPFITPQIKGPDALAERAALRGRSRRELAIPKEAFVVVSCGTANDRKGIDIFLEAALDYLNRHPDPLMRFVWIGDGEDLPKSRELVEASGYGDQFVFAGFRTDAARMMACGDVFVLSSREDPFPLVCMEAGQYAIPVIYFDKGTGIGKFVRSGEDDAAGIEVPAFSRPALADAIHRLRTDDDLRRTYGAAGRLRVFETYANTGNILRLYGVLINNGLLAPSVTAIVPNYNHEKYLDQRLITILEQDLKTLEVIVLDDYSTDNSHAVIREYLKDPRVSFEPNTKNSGSPFGQWVKGIRAARADVVWIAESDDYADPDFAMALIGSFADPAVTIATGRTVITGGDGTPKEEALDGYWNRAETDLFKGSWTRDGVDFVRTHFGALCTLVNASGLLIRRSSVMPVAKSAIGYKMCGDWLIYLKVLLSGKVFFSEKARNYFRRHEESTVYRIEGTPQYFKERANIARYVISAFPLRRNEIERILWELKTEWDRFSFKNPDRTLDDFIDQDAFRASANKRRGTVAFYIHDVTTGRSDSVRGGVQVANRLHFEGYDVIVYGNGAGQTAPAYSLNEGIRLIDINLKDDGADLRLASALKHDRVDVFVPMLSDWLFESAIRAGRIAGTYVIASEQNDPWLTERMNWGHKSRQTYLQMVDAIHLLLPSFIDSLIEPLHERVTVIPNGVDMGADFRDVSTCEAHSLICTAPYLPAKHLHTLIEAFALLADAFPDWTLNLVGDGELRPALLDQVKALGLEGRVHLPRHSPDMHRTLVESGIFVLPSASENFGISIVEAQRAGLPCIAFKDCSGPNALIESGVNGELVTIRSAKTLAATLSKLMEDVKLRQTYGQESRKAASRYELNLVLQQWVDFIDSAMAERV